VGSAGRFQLSARGVSVIGIDQYAPPYPWGSTQARSSALLIAAEAYERTTTPDGRQHPATRREIGRMYDQCIAPYLPWLGTEPLRTVSCLYTSTRGSRFVIDRHPEHDSVVIVSACLGHGFKHSPAIGEAVAQWLTRHRPDIDLGAFGLSNARR
jgi:sarcosine oxidase